MSVHSTSSRQAGTSVAAAVTGLVVTLVAFVVVFSAFLLAPLALFGVALACYLVLRPRSARSAGATTSDTPSGTASDDGAGALGHGFGSGVR
ncbi:hypothetical protein [Nocardioides rubriscoriae]|uniref:hypothetical protein n=1 Tax=Nocardioides rubriscoriae TaxID=642762 RepID=UPI0011DF6F47|nr:hypothetical protein [Nocardioides rubriscoriae]